MFFGFFLRSQRLRVSACASWVIFTPMVGSARPVAEARPVDVEGEAPEEAPASETVTLTVVRPGDQPSPPATTGELLRAVPGLQLRRFGPPGARGELLLRGAGAHQLAVFLDGVPLSGGRGGAFDLSTLPTQSIERVEVVRGPTAALYGSGMGGVLNVHTRDQESGDQGTARLTLGSFGHRGVDGGVFQTLGETRLAFFIAGERANGDFPFVDLHGVDRRRGNAAHVALHTLARARTFGSGGDRLTLQYEHAQDARGEPGLEQFERSLARQRRSRDALSVVFEASPAEALRLVARAHARTSFYAFDDPKPARAGSAHAYTARDQDVGLHVVGEYAGFEEHLPRFALALRHEASQTSNDGLFDPPVSARRLGAALVLTETYAPLGEVLLLEASLRLDGHDGRAPLLVPMAGVVVAPRTGLRLKATVGRVFRDPSFDELYFVGPGLRGRPDLRPEEGLAFDAGLSLQHEGLSLSLTYFGQRYERIILFVPVQAFQIEARDDFAARVDGLELSIDGRLNPLRFEATATLLDARLETASNAPLPFRPRQAAFGRLTLGQRPVRAFVDAELRGPVTANLHGNVILPATQRFGLGAAVDVLQTLEATLRIDNLLDRRADLDALQQPLPGRSFLVTFAHTGG